MSRLDRAVDKDLTDVIIPWVVNNLDQLTDEELINCFAFEAENTHSQESKLNFYNHPRLIRLRFCLSTNSMAKLMNTNIQMVSNLETHGLAKVGKTFATVYLDRLRYLVYSSELFIQTYHTRELKDIFKKAYEKFSDARQLIPYILMESIFRQTLVKKLEPQSVDNIRGTKLSEEFLRYLVNLKN